MYDFVDRPVTSLDHGGRFLIWSMRSWVRSLHGSKCPCTAIGPAFVKWNMMTGLPHFNMMMAILNREGIQNLSFGQLGCLRVREHEAVIISLIRSLYVGKHYQVRDTLQLLVHADATTNMMTALTALGHAMVGAGLFPSAPAYDPHVRDYSDE
jgi:hypothetical protein